MRAFFEERGYTVGALIFDGLLVERRQQNGPPLNAHLLWECEIYIEQHTQLRMGLSEKSMAPTADDYASLLQGHRVIRNEKKAALEILLQRDGQLAHTTAGLAIFEPQYGLWSLDQEYNISQALQAVMRGLEHYKDIPMRWRRPNVHTQCCTLWCPWITRGWINPIAPSI
jgi:hypothetical protein